MRVLESVDAIDPGDFAGGSAVAIGKFDGVHRGHRAILDLLTSEASARGLESVVFTFVNNPLSVLRPEACPHPLSSTAQRIEALADSGVEHCVMVEFDRAFSEIPATEFVERILVGMLRVDYVILGSDFRFGRFGQGDAALLRELGAVHGFTVEVVDSVMDEEHGAVSSSRIREAVLAGDVRLAGTMLGRPYSVRGEVVHGDARGRELGFPTANLGVDPAASAHGDTGDRDTRERGAVEGLVPADGVYAGTATIDGVSYTAAISVGVNLTFDPEGDPRVEAFLLDFEGDLYGKRMEVRFFERIRPMLPFDSVEALVARMHEDVAETRRIAAEQW